MIDVSGSGSHSLDQREFQERSRHYQVIIKYRNAINMSFIHSIL